MTSYFLLFLKKYLKIHYFTIKFIFGILYVWYSHRKEKME